MALHGPTKGPSLYRFGGGNESSQESIVFQDMIGEIEIDVLAPQDEVSPWKRKKSTEEKL